MKVLLVYLSWAIICFSIIISSLLIFNRSKINGFLYYFGIWMIIESILEISSTLTAAFGFRNIFFFHINAVLEFTVLILYFNSLFKEIRGPEIHKILWPGLILILTNTLFFQDYTQYNSNALTPISLTMVFFSLFYFIKLFDEKMDLEKKLFRLILTGCILIIHCAQLFPVLFGNIMFELELREQSAIWVVRAVIVLITRVIIFYTLLGHFISHKVQS